MRTTTAERLREILSRRNLRQVLDAVVYRTVEKFD